MTPSRHQAMTRPTPSAPKRARAFWMASPPSAYMPFRTSEVANPVGNFRFSTLIIWRFMGMAMKRPRKRMDATHRASCQVGRVRPENMVRAGTAFESPAEAMKAQAAAMVTRTLFSRIPMSRLTRNGQGDPEGLEDGEGHDGRRDGDPQAPARLEAHVEVGEAHDGADDGAQDDGAEREFGLPAPLVDVVEPIAFPGLDQFQVALGLLVHGSPLSEEVEWDSLPWRSGGREEGRMEGGMRKAEGEFGFGIAD